MNLLVHLLDNKLMLKGLEHWRHAISGQMSLEFLPWLSSVIDWNLWKKNNKPFPTHQAVLVSILLWQSIRNMDNMWRLCNIIVWRELCTVTSVVFRKTTLTVIYWVIPWKVALYNSWVNSPVFRWIKEWGIKQ